VSARARTARWALSGLASDVLVYIMVLNLFVEWAPAVVIESFTTSILTAVALKALLDLIIGFEHRVNAFFKERDQRVLGILATLAILFLSKFVILEAVDILFGDNVELGGFFMIAALIIALMAARAIVQALYQRLGHAEPAAETP
jgi:hypothetical protein